MTTRKKTAMSKFTESLYPTRCGSISCARESTGRAGACANWRRKPAPPLHPNEGGTRIAESVAYNETGDAMPEKFLDALARGELPAFVTQQSERRLLRRLHGAGYVDARFFPEARTDDQFAELRAVTPLGRRVLGIITASQRG